MASTRDETIREVTETYLQTINPKHPPSPDVIQGAILDDIAVKFNGNCILPIDIPAEEIYNRKRIVQ